MRPDTSAARPGSDGSGRAPSRGGSSWWPRSLLPPAGARDPELLRRQLKWLIGLRLVVVTSVVVLYVLLSLLPEQQFQVVDSRFLLLITGLAYAASLLYIVLILVGERHVGLQAHIQFLGDLLLITALVYYFGGATSPFSMLYLIVISISAVLLRRRAAVLVANIAYLLYASTLLALYFGWVTSPHAPSEPITMARMAYNLTTHLLGFYAIAILSSYLARNITIAERELAARQEEMAELQIMYHNVVQSISSGLITTDLEGRVTSINRVGARLLGVEPEWLIGEPVTSTGLFSEREWRTLSRSDAHSSARQRREVERPPGSAGASYIGYSLTPLADSHDQREGNIVAFQDLTEWRQLQNELRLKDRMAAVGEMAAGLAHEIGNPLAAISGSVQLLQPPAAEDPRQAKLVGILRRESLRLERTVKSFLQFARPKERSSVRFDIAALLSEHVALLDNSPEIGPNHRVELELSPPEAYVFADADQISQIFWNLVRNGLKAMPEGGTLSISGQIQGDRYRFAVRDTGCGMSEVERARLFQPFKSFFDEGTGIGMAIVYRIVEEHGGRLLVDSTPEQGTTITAELPVAGKVGLAREEVSV